MEQAGHADPQSNRFGRLPCVGGTPLEAIERWDHMRGLGLARGLSKVWLAKNLLPFVFSRRDVAGIDAGNAYTANAASKPEAGRNDKEPIQFDFVTAKLARLGIADKVKLELEDYRQIEGEGVYDKIAQIEMFEHVGLDNHDRHFLQMHKLLKPRGLYLHQASTRRATRDLSRFREQTSYMKFITTCIFPGGELDHIGLTVTNLERLGFEVHDVEDWREHFSRTTRLWSERLAANRAAAEAEVGAAKTRLWLAYFAMTTLGFWRGPILVYQTLASKRRSGASGLPWTRKDLYR